jgi:predicted RNase H-like nuclease (RuvC/YqgF family)
MRYLKSTTQKSYMLNGKKIPQCVTKDNEWLTLNDSAYAEFAKVSVVASLIKSGAIIVTDKEPTTPTKQVSQLTQANAKQAMEITTLHEEIAELKKQLAGSANSAEVDSLKVALEKQREEDLAEIKQLQADKDAVIADKDTEIAELKKQLAAAKKGSK